MVNTRVGRFVIWGGESEVTLNFIEKRIFRRLVAEVEVEVDLGSKILKANTSNISCGGMFLKVDPASLHAGSRGDADLQMAIHLPNHKSPVKLVGQVRRSTHHGVAVEFQGLYNDNILAIERFVKSLLN